MEEHEYRAEPATEEERAEGRRHAALHHAATTYGSGFTAEEIVRAAKAFEAFLRGE